MPRIAHAKRRGRAGSALNHPPALLGRQLGRRRRRTAATLLRPDVRRAACGERRREVRGHAPRGAQAGAGRGRCTRLPFSAPVFSAKRKNEVRPSRATSDGRGALSQRRSFLRGALSPALPARCRPRRRRWRWRSRSSAVSPPTSRSVRACAPSRAALLRTRLSAPALRAGICGMPNVGKSTLFNVLTKCTIPAENFPFCTIDPNNVRTTRCKGPAARRCCCARHSCGARRSAARSRSRGAC